MSSQPSEQPAASTNTTAATAAPTGGADSGGGAAVVNFNNANTNHDEPVAVASADPEERQAQYSAAVIASSFANMELQSMRKTLTQTTTSLNKLQEENARLREEMQERDRDALQVVEFLRREVEKKQDQIEVVRKQAEEIQEAGEKRLQQEVSSLMFVVKEKEDALDKAEDDIKRLEDEIDSVAEFKRQKHELTQELTSIRQHLLETKEKYERELSRANFSALEERVRLKGEKKDFIDKFKEEVNVRAMELLDEKTRTIYEQNRTLIVEKRSLEKELQGVNKELSDATAQLRAKARELELIQQNQHLAGKMGYKLRKEVQTLSQRNLGLEDTVRSVAERYELELHKVRTAHTTEVGAMGETVTALKNAVDVRTRELRKMRSLTRGVVQQRTELETFFHEALSYVKERKVLELTQGPSVLQQQQQGGASSRGSAASSRSVALPAITPPPPGGGSKTSSGAVTPAPPPPPPDPSRVDVSQLSWDDKERVLRILFARINATGGGGTAPAQQQQHSRRPPQPPSGFITQSPATSHTSTTFLTQQQQQQHQQQHIGDDDDDEYMEDGNVYNDP
eukprot:PhM_4_TR8420/c3_g2_i1/m.55436